MKTKTKLFKSSPSKVPKSWPTYVLKCVWDSTAVLLKVRAKDEPTALEFGWKRMRKTEGGEKCQQIRVKEIRWNT